MDQKVWGPHTWFFLHSVTFNYPFKPTAEDKAHITQFFKEIEDILPCSICRRHYKGHLKKKPIQADGRKELVYWLIDLHNIVNIQEHKPTMSYAAVLKLYSDAYHKQILLEDPRDGKDKSNDEFSLYTDRKRFKGCMSEKICAGDNGCMEFNIWYVLLVVLLFVLLGLSIYSSLNCGNGKVRGRGRK